MTHGPLVVLHDHLDGGVRPSTVLDLCHAVGVATPADDAAALGEWMTITPGMELVDAFSRFDLVNAGLQTADALRRVALEGAHAGLGGRSSWPVWLTVSGVKPSGRVPFGVVRPPDTRRLAGFSAMAERIGRLGGRFILVRNHNRVILPTVVHRMWTTSFVGDQSSIGATRSMSSRQ